MEPSPELDKPVDFAFLAEVFPFIGQTFLCLPEHLESPYQALWEAALDTMEVWCALQDTLLSTSAAEEKRRLAATILPLTDLSQAIAAFLQASGPVRYAQHQQGRRNLDVVWRQLANTLPLKAVRRAFGRHAHPCLAYLQAHPALSPLGGRALKCLIDSFAPAVYLMERAHAEQVNLKWGRDEWGVDLFNVAAIHVFETERMLGRLASARLASARPVFDEIGVFFAVVYPTSEPTP